MATTPDPVQDTDVTGEVVKKIAEAQNVLVVLSSDPSVDEMSAAIGLSLYLDRLGKRATAIYSGSTPNALEFLKPEETFEPTVDTLQDFVIALNKEKADHLRYKLDGDFVKIYITPYRTRISEEDLDFSYGDFNVDLVLALEIPVEQDLPLFFSELLEDVVLRVLGSDPSECLGLDGNAHGIAAFVFFIDFFRIHEADLKGGILDSFHHFLARVNEEITGDRVDLYGNIVSRSEMVPAGLKERIVDHFQKRFSADALFFFEDFQCFP